MPAREDGEDVFVPDGAEEGDAVLQEVVFAHLEEFDEFGAVAACVGGLSGARGGKMKGKGYTDDKVDVGELRADCGCGGDEEVHAFAICEAGQDDDCNWKNQYIHVCNTGTTTYWYRKAVLWTA